MTRDDYASIKAHFLAAANLPEAEREGYLAAHCANESQRDAVRALLAQHTETGATVSATQPATRISTGPPATPGVKTPAGSSSGLSGADEPQSGALIANRFRIVSKLGEGGMGAVYRAHDTLLDQPVALKFLAPGLTRHAALLERMRNEVRLAREITHPNVCRVHDLVVHEGVILIAMEYIDGEDLRSLLRRIGALSEAKSLEFAHQMCSGLAAAHARGVLHRDLKPANVMIDGHGQARLTDFGLAARGRVEGVEIRSGTPSYMAPEQLAGVEVTERSDIYALGLMIYEMFTGRPAVTASSAQDVAAFHKSRTPAPPSDAAPQINPDIERVIMRCIAKSPADRPGSALAVAGALPGGDALATARKAGVVPSPELLATIEHRRALSARRVAWLLTGIVAGFVLLLSFNPRLSERSPAQPAAALRFVANQLLAAGGSTEPPMHAAEGFARAGLLQFDRPTRIVPEGWRIATLNDDLVYWRRANPESLITAGGDNLRRWGRVTFSDPPRAGQRVLLHGDGRLLLFDTWAPAAPWSDALLKRLAEAARCTLSGEAYETLDFRTAAPANEVRLYDAVRDDDPAPVSLLVVLADERLQCLAAIEPATTEHSSGLAAAGLLANTLQVGLWGILLMAAVPLTIAHRSQGRGDADGALRIGMFIAMISWMAWLLGHKWTADVTHIAPAFHGLILSLGIGAASWLFYAAMEPFLRRHWPDAVVGWTRVLRGQWRDPLVGRELLIGVAAGVLLRVLILVDAALPAGLGLDVREADPRIDVLEGLLGGRQAFGAVVTVLLLAVYNALTLLLVLVIGTALLQRRWLAAAVAILVIAGLFSPRGSHMVLSWITIGLVCGSFLVWLIMRHGLLATVAALFVNALLLGAHYATILAGWSTQLLLQGALIVLGLAGLGAWLALSRSRGYDNLMRR